MSLILDPIPNPDHEWEEIESVGFEYGTLEDELARYLPEGTAPHQLKDTLAP